MSDLTPPPDEPLPDQARARMRGELIAAAAGADAVDRRWQRWMVPGVAAAAVLLVVGMAGLVVHAGRGPSSSPPLATAPSSPASTSAPASGAPLPSSTPDLPTLPSAYVSIGSATPSWLQGGAGSGGCGDEVGSVVGGTRQVARIGRTTFWANQHEFVLCDDSGGTTTVQHPQPLTGGPARGVEAYRLSTVAAPADSGYTEIRVAGGLVPQGTTAFNARYTFPDGHTESATTTTDDQGRTWWRMTYSSHEAPGVNELDLPPIQVEVSLSGVQQHYRLSWGVDTCAQANHGC